MSKADEPRLPDAPGTEPPVREFVVRDPDPKRVKEEPQKKRSLLWLWILLALVVLGLLLALLLRGCDRDDNVACTVLPDNVFTTAVQSTAVNTLDEWIPGVAANYNPEAVVALRTLCNYRLANAGSTPGYDLVQSTFDGFAPNLAPEVITNIQNLLTGNTFCRCS